MKRVWQRLKDHFIPHPGNDHRPHFFRWETTLSVLLVSLFIEIVFLGQVFLVFPKNFLAVILPDVIVNLTNGDRAANAAAPLAESGILDAAAQAKAEDMAAKGYFAHYAPDGTTPWHWFQVFGYRYSYAGENLAVNFTDSKDIVEAWMNSPKHRENIVNGSYTDIGIGVAEGVYEGRPATFVVQFFGRPAVAPTPVAIPAPSSLPALPAPVAVVPAPSIPVPQNVLPASTEVPADTPTPAPEPQREPVPEPYLVATEDMITDVSGAPPAPAAGSTVPAPSSLVAELVTNPRALADYLYAVLATIILTALVLAAFLRLRMPHPRLLVNAALMLLVIAAALSLNQWIALAQAAIR